MLKATDPVGLIFRQVHVVLCWEGWIELRLTNLPSQICQYLWVDGKMTHLSEAGKSLTPSSPQLKGRTRNGLQAVNKRAVWDWQAWMLSVRPSREQERWVSKQSWLELGGRGQPWGPRKLLWGHSSTCRSTLSITKTPWLSSALFPRKENKVGCSSCPWNSSPLEGHKCNSMFTTWPSHLPWATTVLQNPLTCQSYSYCHPKYPWSDSLFPSHWPKGHAAACPTLSTLLGACAAELNDMRRYTQHQALLCPVPLWASWGYLAGHGWKQEVE